MAVETWTPFFNSSARSGGDRYFTEGKVSFSQPSSTEIVAYVKPSSSFKVTLQTDSLQNKNILTDCTCPASKRGQLCKHIWAACRAVLEKSPEFFEDKNEIQKKQSSVQSKPLSESVSQARLEAQAAFKAKQNAYRKEQYQKQKQRLKEQKTSQKSSRHTPSMPEEVTTALAYFSANGFSLEKSLNEDAVYLARKKLSKIFHPDAGGSHNESLELNHNSEVLLKYVGGR